jgi:hypothetical protein
MTVTPEEVKSNLQNLIKEYVKEIDEKLKKKKTHDYGADGYFIEFNKKSLDSRVVGLIKTEYKKAGWGEVRYSKGNRDWPTGFVFREKPYSKEVKEMLDKNKL